MQSELNKLIHGSNKVVKSNPPASNNNNAGDDGKKKNADGQDYPWGPDFLDPIWDLYTNSKKVGDDIGKDVKKTIEVGALVAVAGIGLLLYAAYENRHEIESAVKGVAKAGFDVARVAI